MVRFNKGILHQFIPIVMRDLGLIPPNLKIYMQTLEIPHNLGVLKSQYYLEL